MVGKFALNASGDDMDIYSNMARQSHCSQRAAEIGKRFFLNKYVVLFAMVVVIGSLFQPPSLAYTKFSFLTSWYEIARTVCGVAVLCAYIAFAKKDTFCLVAVLFIGTCVFSTYINGGDTISNAKSMGQFLVVILLVATARKSYSLELYWAVFAVSMGLCLATLATMIIYPNGLFETATMPRHDCFFFGHRNSSFKIAIPLLLATALLDAFKQKWISARTVFACFVGIMLVTTKFSATSFLAVCMFIAGMFLVKAKKIRPYFNGFTYIALYAIFFFGVIVFRLQDILTPVFDLLGRNATFTGRTAIWDYIFSLMSTPSHLLFGYGDGFSRSLTIGTLFTGSAHNTVLHIFLIGGYVALAFLLILLLGASFRTFLCRRKLVSAYAALAMGSLLLVGLMENVITVSFFMVLAIAYYLPDNANAENVRLEKTRGSFIGYGAVNYGNLKGRVKRVPC